MPSKATLELMRENGLLDEPTPEEQGTTAQPNVLSMLIAAQAQGTLTEDEVILERYMDVSGNESLRILKHAFLNSYF